MIIGLFARHSNDFILLVVIAGYSRTRTRKIIIIRVFQRDRGKEKTDRGTTIRLTFFSRRRNKNDVFIHGLRGTYLFPSWEADRKISRKGNGKRN